MPHDNSAEVRDFLASRRARLSPQQAGLTVFGGNRRVPGLRREEVAMLAGVSNDYYVRLERGNLSGASAQVLDAISQALQLDDAERRHLQDLARAAGPGRPRRATRPTVPASVHTMLDAMSGAPAVVRDDRLEILAVNSLGRALYAPLFAGGDGRANHARFAFLDPAAQDFWVDWNKAANDTVGVLRSMAGRSPHDPALTTLIGELSTRSEEFRTRWARHDVHLHSGGIKRIHHPVVGPLELSYDSLSIAQAPGLTMLVYTAEPGSASEEALRILASWSATDPSPKAGTAVAGASTGVDRTPPS